MSSERLQKVLREIDAANAADPRPDPGSGEPYELAYSKWVSGWVTRLAPEASEELLIAARGQHVRRWEIPRESYPEDRAGYLRWREELKKLHAGIVAGLMRSSGYPGGAVEKVERIILKKNIRDPESQLLEDALCLVFLERQFADLRKKEPDEKMIEILRKTWRKMGEKGRSEALKLPLPAPELALIQKALNP